MRYQCINCGKEQGEEDHNNIDGHLSHGLCKLCLKIALIPTYRKRQIAAGYDDCFGKCNGFCERVECCYIDLCTEMGVEILLDEVQGVSEEMAEGQVSIDRGGGDIIRNG